MEEALMNLYLKTRAYIDFKDNLNPLIKQFGNQEEFLLSELREALKIIEEESILEEDGD